MDLKINELCVNIGISRKRVNYCFATHEDGSRN
jgi:hypothetical protein